MITGWCILGGSWIVSVISAGLVALTSAGLGSDVSPVTTTLFVPVVGPWISVGFQVAAPNSSDVIIGLTIVMGLVQLTGLVLGAYGTDLFMADKARLQETSFMGLPHDMLILPTLIASRVPGRPEPVPALALSMTF